MKRRIAIIIVFLLLGAIVNVAVAWGVMFKNQSVEVSGDTDRRPLTPAEEHWSRSVLLPAIYRDYPTVVRDIPVAEEVRRTGWRKVAVTEELYPQYVPVHGLRTRITFTSECSIESGWPFRSLFLDPVLWDRSALGTLTNARPIWPAFIANTLIHAMLIWLLVITPFAARRMLRRRRGQCEKCAYPIGVSTVCTECGAAVTRRESAQSEPGPP